MTDYQTTPIAAPAPTKNKIRNRVLIGAGTVGAILLGMTIGAALVEPEVVVEEKEVIVEVPSSSCLEALDLADQGFTIVADIMESITQSDVYGMRDGNSNLRAIAGDYNFLKSSCRLGS